MQAFYCGGTHWDREWYAPFQEYRLWLVQNLDAALARLEADPRERVFHLDGQTVLLEDYLEIRPDRREALAGYLRQGRLRAGPWYAPPDLWLVSGEALIRNLSRGMRIVEGFGAASAQVAYTPDQFGHIGCMPMVYAGFGLHRTVVWRGLNDDQVRAQFYWVGPDGSRVLAHKLPDNIGYGWFGGAVRWQWDNAGHAPAALQARLREALPDEAERLAVPVMLLSDGGDHQAMPERVPELLDMAAQAHPDITFTYGSLDDYFAAVETAVRDGLGSLDAFPGELRYPARATGNLYHALIPHCLSSRYPLKQANDRCQNLLTLWAEPMAAYALMQGHRLAPGFLETAWKWLLLNQPHDSICGCSIDATHDDMPFRYHQAALLGDGVRRQGWAALATPVSAIAPDATWAVWNPLPYARHGVFELELALPADFPARAMRSGHNLPVVNQFDLLDAERRPVAWQLLSIRPDRTVKLPDRQGRLLKADSRYDLYRLAVKLALPAAGYTTLTVKPLEGVGTIKRVLGRQCVAPLRARNAHLDVTVQHDGTVRLEHMASGRRYEGLFQYADGGDRGDGWNYVPPAADAAVISPGRTVQCGVETDGPLQTTFRIARTLRVPAALDTANPDARAAAMTDLSIVDYLTLRADDPMLHVRTEVCNTAGDHRLQVLFPTTCDTDTVMADQPFMWVSRPIATDPGSDRYKEPDPVERPHHTALAVAAGDGGLAVLCPEGLHEHSVFDDAGRTLALTLFRAVGRTVQTDGEPGAQTYGRMDFQYALMPFAGAVDAGALTHGVLAMQAGIATHVTSAESSCRSLLAVDAGPAVVVSAVKPSDDGHGVAVRLWNTGDTATEAVMKPSVAPSAAYRCDLREQAGVPIAIGADGSVAVTVPPRGLATVRLDYAVPAG